MAIDASPIPCGVLPSKYIVARLLQPSPFLGLDKFGCTGNVCTHIPCKVSAYGLLLKSPPCRLYFSREPCRKSTDTF